MADTLALDIRASLAWLFQDALELATVADASRLEYAATLEDGTAADQADRLWHDQRTLATGTFDDLDLGALVQTVFGGSLSLGMAKVKALLVVNLATTAGEDLAVGGAAAQAWAAPFGAAGDIVRVAADSCLLLVNKKPGWAVAAGSSDRLRIANSGAASITYQIVIVGTSA